jgi:hypothetical protein
MQKEAADTTMQKEEKRKILNISPRNRNADLPHRTI